jgi:aldehyde:ferredoxin oxidoreductase
VGELLNAIYGWDVSIKVLADLGRKTLDLERAFNRGAGLGPEDDRLPNWMKEEPLPPTGSKFDVTDEAIDQMWLEE